MTDCHSATDLCATMAARPVFLAWMRDGALLWKCETIEEAPPATEEATDA